MYKVGYVPPVGYYRIHDGNKVYSFDLEEVGGKLDKGFATN